MQPRWYQLEAVDGFFATIRTRPNGQYPHPLLLMPTGVGKSVVIALVIQKLLGKRPTLRSVVGTHVKELVYQDYLKMKEIWPSAPAGVISAGLNMHQIGRQVTFAGIASIKGLAAELGWVDVFFIDEAHLLNTKETTMYMRVLSQLWAINPRMIVCGLTATGWRTKGGMLHELENRLFNCVAYDCTTPEHWRRFVDEGYLSLLVAPADLETEMRYENVATGADGDFNLKQLQAAVDDYKTTQAAVSELIERAGGGYGTVMRQAGIVFSAGIEHGDHIYKAMRERGQSAMFVHSKMRDDERDEAIAGWKAGKYRWAVNNGILTTGVDFPALDVMGGMRPTKSSALKGQMEGRLTRVFNGKDKHGRPHPVFGPKEDALVCDFARNTERLGTIDDPVIPGDKSKRRALKAGMAVTRKCPMCETHCSARAVTCHKCGYVFPWVEPKIDDEASKLAPMFGEKTKKKKEKEKPETLDFEVTQMEVRRHHSRGLGKPDSVLVTFKSGIRTFDMWLCFDHEGNARAKALETWTRFTGDPFPPASVAEALERAHELPTPTKVKVWHNKKPYPQVMNYEFR